MGFSMLTTSLKIIDSTKKEFLGLILLQEDQKYEKNTAVQI